MLFLLTRLLVLGPSTAESQPCEEPARALSVSTTTAALLALSLTPHQESGVLLAIRHCRSPPLFGVAQLLCPFGFRLSPRYEHALAFGSDWGREDALHFVL